MGTVSARQLFDLHATLYQRAFAAAQARTSISAPRLKNYAHNFQKMLPDQFEQVDEGAILDHLLEQDVLLYGDFHTLKQSQRGLLRLLRGLVHRNPERPIVLALEMFLAEHQSLVDAYLNDKITEHQLCDSIDYKHSWGFPWSHYAPLLELAKRHQIKVRAINTRAKAEKKSPYIRDHFFAEKIVSEIKQQPSALVIALVGEYHLADEHLPSALHDATRDWRSKIRCSRIVNNVDRYYFALMKNSDRNLQSEYLRLRPDLHCVINTPAWIKWRSLLNWEDGFEAASASLEDRDLELFNDDSLDLDQQLTDLLQHLSEFLGLSLKGAELQGFTIWRQLGGEELQILRKKHGMRIRDIDTLVQRAELDGYFSVEKKGLVVIREPSLNALACVAGQYIQAWAHGETLTRGRNASERFYVNMLKSCAAAFSCRVLNPKRKFANIGMAENFLQKTKGRRVLGENRQKREFAKYLIGFERWMLGKVRSDQTHYRSPLKGLYAYDERVFQSLSSSIGQQLGTICYDLFVAEKIDLVFLRQLFTDSRRDFSTMWSFITRLYRAHYFPH